MYSLDPNHPDFDILNNDEKRLQRIFRENPANLQGSIEVSVIKTGRKNTRQVSKSKNHLYIPPHIAAKMVNVLLMSISSFGYGKRCTIYHDLDCLSNIGVTKQGIVRIRFSEDRKEYCKTARQVYYYYKTGEWLHKSFCVNTVPECRDPNCLKHFQIGSQSSSKVIDDRKRKKTRRRRISL